jgi:hypothetical protein
MNPKIRKSEIALCRILDQMLNQIKSKGADKEPVFQLKEKKKENKI